LYLLLIPYDGKDAGDFIGDAIRNFNGKFLGLFGGNSTVVFWAADNGLFYGGNNGGGYIPAGFVYSDGGNRELHFDPARVVPTSYENRPASISALVCISY